MKNLGLAFVLASVASTSAFADYQCMNQARKVAESIMLSNGESIDLGESDIRFVKLESSEETNVFDIIGNKDNEANTIAYRMSMSLSSGCVTKKFELIGAQ